MNTVTEDIVCGQPRPLDNTTRPFIRPNRLLFQQFENEVVTIDTRQPIKPLWIPLQSTESSGCGYTEYHPLPLSLVKSSSEDINGCGLSSSSTQVGVSSSQLFLLNYAACNVLRVPLSVMVTRVIDVEKILRRHGLMAMITRDVFNNSAKATL